MTQAEELLNSLTPADIALYTAKPGIEEHIVIDDNRNIIVPDMLKRIAVQYDNCIETVTFDCPRYWDENDLSTMNIYINYVRSDNVAGLCLAKNIRVDEEDSNIIHFDWLIGDEITIVSGALQFAISAKKMGEDEELRWYSEINTQMTVSKGLDNAEIVVEEHPDILNEILDKVDNMTVDNDVKNAIKTLQTDLDALENKVDNFDIPEQVQVDWNQNDSTRPDYIKNRICYTDGEIIVKLPEKYLPDTVATKQYVDDIFNSIVNGDEVSY